MPSVKELHDQAMIYYQKATLERSLGNFSEWRNYLQKALENDYQAAKLLPNNKSSEPTRSILYQSAASIAYQMEDIARSMDLICEAISGSPPEGIRFELFELLDKVRILDIAAREDAALSADELRLSLDSSEHGPGLIELGEFKNRIEGIRTLIYRTCQRLSRKFIEPIVNMPFDILVFAPKFGSFSMYFKLFQPKNKQMELLYKLDEIFVDIIENVDLFENNKHGLLKSRIGSDAYFINFLSLIKKIAPDGKKINKVLFSTSKRKIALAQYKDDIDISKFISLPAQAETRRTRLVGTLDFANRRKRLFKITPKDKSAKSCTIIVHEGLDDVVRANFGRLVEIVGDYDPKSKLINLVDIKESSELNEKGGT